MIKSNLNTISKLNPMSFISSNHWVLTIYKIFKIINLSTQLNNQFINPILRNEQTTG